MTDLLFQTDAYCREFSATVTAVTENGVVLDRTAFYPGGGGQPCDFGTLYDGDMTWSVGKVKKVSGQLVHFVNGAPPAVGTAVTGVLNWERRYDLMRRFNHMFGMKFDLGDLEDKSMELIDAMEAQIVEMEEKIPDLKSELYLQQVADEFTEQPFNPLDDVWAEGLEDLFGDGDGESE